MEVAWLFSCTFNSKAVSQCSCHDRTDDRSSRHAQTDRAAAKTPSAAMPKNSPGFVAMLCHSAMAFRRCKTPIRPKSAPVIMRYAFMVFVDLGYRFREQVFINQLKSKVCLSAASTVFMSAIGQAPDQFPHPRRLPHCPSLSLNQASARNPWLAVNSWR